MRVIKNNRSHKTDASIILYHSLETKNTVKFHCNVLILLFKKVNQSLTANELLDRKI